MLIYGLWYKRQNFLLQIHCHTIIKDYAGVIYLDKCEIKLDNRALWHNIRELSVKFTLELTARLILWEKINLN